MMAGFARKFRIGAGFLFLISSLLGTLVSGLEKPHVGLIRERVERLKTLGTVLYVAAHPDDENTALLSYFVHARHLRTAYLSMTRGDGGQNLIGTEKGFLLGLLRTHELLSARSIDGAEQYFTRAIDFGYSKTADETLKIWDKAVILGDVVRIYRRLQPDIVITRFPPDGYQGHGHHVASARLAVEAFQLSARADAYPDQLKEGLKPWQPRRILWNAWRFRGQEPEGPIFTMNIQAFFPYLGFTTGEMAAMSRSMHRSQGFGAGVRRGEWPESFRLLAGAPFQNDLFEGIDMSWHRVPGGADVARYLEKMENNLDPDRPVEAIKGLYGLLDRIRGLPQTPLVQLKRNETLDLIRMLAGLFIEFVADKPEAVPGEDLKVTLGIENRGVAPVRLISYRVFPVQQVQKEIRESVQPGQYITHEAILKVPQGMPLTSPYWLEEPPRAGHYRVRNPKWIGLARTPPAFHAEVNLEISGRVLTYNIPLTYRWVDPVLGERRRDVVVAPAFNVQSAFDVVYFPDNQPRTLSFQVERIGDHSSHTLVPVIHAEKWQVEPQILPVVFSEDQTAQTINLKIHPPDTPSNTDLFLHDNSMKGINARQKVIIDYPHIPVLELFPETVVRLVRVNIKRSVQRIGYIMGSGDDIPVYLRQIGYQVTLLTDEDLESGDLNQYEVIIAGIRAYNTRPVLARVYDRLMAYIRDGGVYLVQYSTTRRLVTSRIGPHPFELSRDRITVEDAPLQFVIPEHPILNRPHRLTREDFENWVQERGLYFARNWDAHYETPLAGHDPGEKETRGSLLYTRYGEGVFIYTGLAFFRQIPAGVPGALRLFVNLIEAGQGANR